VGGIFKGLTEKNARFNKRYDLDLFADRLRHYMDAWSVKGVGISRRLGREDKHISRLVAPQATNKQCYSDIELDAIADATRVPRGYFSDTNYNNSKDALMAYLR